LAPAMTFTQGRRPAGLQRPEMPLMFPPRCWWTVLCLAVCCAAGESQDRKPDAGGPDLRKRTDALGDPLPPGVLARMGPARFRHGGKVNALAFSADGSQLASASDDRTVRLWETSTGKESRRLAGHASGVLGVRFAAAGRSLVSHDHRTVHFWDAG